MTIDYSSGYITSLLIVLARLIKAYMKWLTKPTNASGGIPGI